MSQGEGLVIFVQSGRKSLIFGLGSKLRGAVVRLGVCEDPGNFYGLTNF